MPFGQFFVKIAFDMLIEVESSVVSSVNENAPTVVKSKLKSNSSSNSYSDSDFIYFVVARNSRDSESSCLCVHDMHLFVSIMNVCAISSPINRFLV